MAPRVPGWQGLPEDSSLEKDAEETLTSGRLPEKEANSQFKTIKHLRKQFTLRIRKFNKEQKWISKNFRQLNNLDRDYNYFKLPKHIKDRLNHMGQTS